MVYVLGVLTALFVVVVAVQAVRGRARVATCCTYVPPGRDARLGLADTTPEPADGPTADYPATT